ncbi:MAG: universal stress protein [Prosthecobacter sp.]|uniref:universal stress protein n=1 Tax=Prosthecobacter sp. TaxID=1965333 RepID=UPI0025FCF511|nr:universal stress protein [Prosthecobacter sp.]MCF7786851.1 universal stress protein [Prosthecobacter sp.]
MKTIVALVDLSSLATEVLRQASTFARAFNSEVVVLHVVPKQPTVVDEGLIWSVGMKKPSHDLLRSNYEKLLEMVAELTQAGVHATVRQMVDAGVDGVLAEISSLQAGLIILGAHPHSTLYHLLIGSMADDVLKSAHCPVLVVPELAQTP